ncbi:hypothetical protein F901_02429 [Acinetobacter dispersus]|uniref:SDR family oxidoreductase n=1 Tax=Acinetobacter dispersus TaxID=70348 RepID=UPI0002CD8CE7|nr:SDR family oxidoreductase [Acinetobacter dispersus]ENX52698.1 hypothetical protein F901_02429 [Acinetobacter dispersus]
MPDNKKVALIIGAGDGTGGAIAKKFAKEGYITCVTRRNIAKLDPLLQEIQQFGGIAHGFGSDARNEQEVIDLIETIEESHGEIDVFVFNIGANVWSSIVDETSRKYYKIWEMACFSAFLSAREVAKKMLPRKKGTIIFTGATASIRGSAHFAAFSGAKHGLRALAQSMARELWSQGIHVAHVIIDGAIDTDFIRENLPLVYARKEHDGILNPEHIAENYWFLHQQPRDAWTFELDLRPWSEQW